MAQLAKDRVSQIHSPSLCAFAAAGTWQQAQNNSHVAAAATWFHAPYQLSQPGLDCLDVQRLLCDCAATIALARCAVAPALSRSWS